MAVLHRADLDRFLRILAAGVPCGVKLVLTGGSEALVLGGRRPTGDIDFGVQLAKRDADHWDAVIQAIAAASDEAGFPVQYSDDIDRWSSISVPLRLRKTRPFRQIGRLRVHLLDPNVWAVYKLARYLDSDVEDLVAVLRAEKGSVTALARLCGVSLRASPRSSSLILFRKQVEHFFRQHGESIWGSGFEPEAALVAFRRAAAIRR